MATVIATWDLPSTPEHLETYNTRSEAWRKTVTSFPGFVEFRAMRNPLLTSPQVLVSQEYEKLEEARSWLQSAELAEIIGEMRSLGCMNITTQVWDKSPIVPNVVRP